MPYPINLFEREVEKSIKDSLSKLKCDTSKASINLEVPSDEKGDLAFPCFSFASVLKKDPKNIAKEVADNIDVEKLEWISQIKVVGAYINFFVDIEKLVQKSVSIILNKGDEYGWLDDKNKKVIVEHTSANPNGPLHVGRARNPIIGDTLVRIFRAAGYDVEAQFYLDDMGKQVAILAWGVNNIDSNLVSGTEYSSDKSDHRFVGFYQMANEKMEGDIEVISEIGDIVKRSEQGDKDTLDMVHSAYEPVLKGIRESLDRINISIDRYIPESKFVTDGSVDSVVESLKTSSYCCEEDGAFYLDLESFGVHGRNTNFFITRRDGTTLYATRDVAYHRWKADQADLLVNVLGEDHRLESKQVEIALKLLDIDVLPRVVFYAFVSLPGGKMSTRRNRVVYLDELIDECINRAYEEVDKRRGEELSSDKIKSIAETVGIGALRYNIIKVQPEKDIKFKWEEALSFEGDAAPFIQYSHARACSIIRKSGIEEKLGVLDMSVINDDSEIRLVKKLALFPKKIEEAVGSCRPNVIANYAFSVASEFNQFYRDCPVLTAEEKLRNARLSLVQATRITLHNTLHLLGIDAPEEM